jgi:hypothetical protein
MSRQDRPLPYHGVYINLDRSVERRDRLEAQLARFGLTGNYSRLPAVDGRTLKLASPLSPGQAGCFLSHCRALEEGRRTGTCLHILEDDAILCEHTAPVIADAVAAQLFDHFDVLFTDTFIDSSLGPLKAMKALFDKIKVPSGRPMNLSDLQVMDLSKQNFACLTSYVVGARSIERVLTLCRQEIAAGARTPVDLLVRQAVHTGKLRAACVFPFVTTFGLEEVIGSTIEEQVERLGKPSVMVFAVLRYSFFIGRDLAYAQRYLDAATRTGRRPTNAHHNLILQALEFLMSDDYKEF